MSITTLDHNAMERLRYEALINPNSRIEIDSELYLRIVDTLDSMSDLLDNLKQVVGEMEDTLEEMDYTLGPVAQR